MSSAPASCMDDSSEFRKCRASILKRIGSTNPMSIYPDSKGFLGLGDTGYSGRRVGERFGIHDLGFSTNETIANGPQGVIAADHSGRVSRT